MKTIIKAMVLSATLICGNVVAEENVNDAEVQAVLDAIATFGNEAYKAGLRGIDIETTGSYIDDLIEKIQDLRNADIKWGIDTTIPWCKNKIDEALIEECGV